MLLVDIDFCGIGDVEEILAMEKSEDAVYWSREVIMEDFRKRHGEIMYMLARKSSVPCGVIAFERLGGAVKILKLDVMELYRRRGVGSQLLAASGTVGESLGCCRVELNVRKANEPAISFYRTLGFRLSDRMPRYYSNGDEALAYRSSLPLDFEMVSR